MNDLFNGLKQNKAFKLVVILIFVFFSLLVYFSKAESFALLNSDSAKAKTS